jgi:hypothetical protein
VNPKFKRMQKIGMWMYIIYVDILDYNWIILKRVLDRAARAI